MDEIRVIDFDELVSFLDTAPDKIYVMPKHGNNFTNYGIFRNGKIISTYTLEVKKNYVKIRCLLTSKEYRNQGVCSSAIDKIICQYPNCKLRVDCNDSSVGIFRKKGFRTSRVLHFRMWNRYAMVYDTAKRNKHREE